MVRMPYTTGGNKKEIENYILLGYYAASSANPLPTFKDNLLVPPFKPSQNVVKELVLLTV